MADVFDAYALYYDLLYRDKDYVDEAEYVAKHIQKYVPDASSILELGCGTGIHAEHLAQKGYHVHGVDISNKMLDRAEARKSALAKDLAKKLSFEHGDVRCLQNDEKYDVVISLFHVMSYQTTNEDLSATFETAAKHLKPGGVFLFDFWYGPTVLKQRPETRVKRLRNDDINVTRLAEPIMHVNENIVDVNYDIFIEKLDSGYITQLQEKHRMRYIFLPEILKYFDSKSWREFKAYKWLSSDEPDDNAWSAFVVAIRK